MKEFDSVKKIKKEALKKIILGIILEIILGIAIITFTIELIYLPIKFGIDKAYWAVLIIMIPVILIFILLFLIYKEKIKLIIKDYKDPINSSIFLRYGSPDKINKIIKDLKKNPIYADNKIIINNKFIYIRKDMNSLCALEDIIAVYKYIELPAKYQKAENGIKYYDKYGNVYILDYSIITSDEEIDRIIKYLIPRCKNAKFGKAKEIHDYIRNYEFEEEPDYNNNRVIKKFKARRLRKFI